MYIRLRLYRIHDYDLYRVYYTKHIDFQHVVRQSLRYYINGENTTIPVGQLDPLPDNVRVSMPVTLTLKDNRDADIIDFISKVTDRLRNLFIKNIVRSYLEGLEVLYFSEEQDTSPPTIPPKQSVRPSKVIKKRTNVSVNTQSRHDPPAAQETLSEVISETQAPDTDDNTTQNSSSSSIFAMADAFF